MADPYSDAMSMALYALAPRAKSRAELHTQLLKRGVEPEISSSVLDSLELQGLLNDLGVRAYLDRITPPPEEVEYWCDRSGTPR